MNEQDIDKLEAGREMDILVAEHVMGQQDFSHPGFFWYESTTEDGTDGWDGFYCPRCSLSGSPDQDHSSPPKCVRHYSTNIADAFLGVEKLRADYQFSIWTSLTVGREFRCRIRKKGTAWDDRFTFFGSFLPLVLCRAMLKAVMEKSNERARY